MGAVRLIQGDCAKVLPTLPAHAFDSLVTDPPAGIGFMGQEWDGDKGGRKCWVAWLAGVFRECLRVLKPGAHGLVWALPRRSHWTGLALEDAGFEVRDCVHHYFLSGWPKGCLDVGKAIDKRLGVEREVIGTRRCMDIRGRHGYRPGGKNPTMTYEYTAPASPEAEEWDGWSTGLKPAVEHWWLVRKPLEGTVVENVLKWGTGALNIDAARIPAHQPKGNPKTAAGGWESSYKPKSPFPEGATSPERVGKGYRGKPRPADPHPDSRYPSHFIVSIEGLLGDHTGFFLPPVFCRKARKCRGEGNVHPTVKPVELMQYFITLLTRPGGHVLDCFAGSFSTAVACKEVGRRFTGIELNPADVATGIRRLGGAA